MTMCEVWLLITDYHLSVGSTPISDSVENLSQYDPGCFTGHKTITLTFEIDVNNYSLTRT